MPRLPRTQYVPPAPVIRPPVGTTYAREAAGNASTLPVNTSFQGFGSSGVIAGTPQDAATALQAVSNVPTSTPALGQGYGSSRIIPNAPGTVNPGATTPTPGGGSFQGFTYTDPVTGKPAYGSATTTAPSVAASQGRGIFVNGQNVTHDAQGNLVPVVGPADNPAAQNANASATLKSLYPDVYTAGTDANKKFVAAAKQAGLNGASDATDLLNLAKSTLPEPAQAGPGNALGEQALADAKNAPNAGTQVGKAINSAVVGTGGAIGGAANAVGNNVGGLLRGLFNVSDAEAKQYGDDYGFDSSKYTNPTSLAPADNPANPTRTLTPTGTPVAPPTNTLATNATSPGVGSLDAVRAPVAGATSKFSLPTPSAVGNNALAPGFFDRAMDSVNGALGIPSAADLNNAVRGTTPTPTPGLAPGALTTPQLAPAVDPEELKKRQYSGTVATL